MGKNKISMKDIQKRLSEIAKLENQKEKSQVKLSELEKNVKSLKNTIRKLRIKKTKDGHEILCYCGKSYTTSKDPNADDKEKRPRCRKCMKRLEPKK